MLFLIAPLIVYPKTSELFEFNKMLFIYFMTTLIITVWLVEIVQNRPKFLNIRWLYIPLGLFFLSQVISTITSIDLHTSLFGYYGRFNGGLVSISAYVLLSLCFIHHYSHQFLIRLLQVSLSASFIVILWGLPGKFGYDLSCRVFVGEFTNSCWTNQFRPSERMFSTLGQPNWLGAYLASQLFISLFFFFRSETKHCIDRIIFGKIGMSLYIVLNILCIFFTRSRSALISVTVSIVIFGILMILRYGPYIYKRIVYICGILCVIGASLIIIRTGIAQIDKFIPSFEKNRSTVTNEKQEVGLSSEVTESFDIRKIVWQGAWELGLRYPLVGTGVETFAYSYYFARPIAHNYTSEWDFLYNKAHNEYLNYFATTGFIGFGAYLVLILVTIILAVKGIFYPYQESDSSGVITSSDKHILSLGVLCSFITILITNFFGFSISVINIYFYLIPAIIYMIANPIVINRSQNTATSINKIIIGLVLMSALFICYSITIYFVADINYNEAENQYQSGNASLALESFVQANKLRYEHVYEDKFAGFLANLALSYSLQKDAKTADRFIALSKYYNDKTLLVSPLNVLYWKTRARIYYYFYQATLSKNYLTTGIRALDKAKELSPSDAKIPYTKALFLSVLEGEEENVAEKADATTTSIREINASIALKDDYRDAYLLKGQLLRKKGQKDEAKKIFEYMIKKFGKDEEIQKELSM